MPQPLRWCLLSGGLLSACASPPVEPVAATRHLDGQLIHATSDGPSPLALESLVWTGDAGLPAVAPETLSLPLPGLDPLDFDHVELAARSSASASIELGSAKASLAGDGRWHTVELDVDWASTEPWRSLTLGVQGAAPVELRRVELVPRGHGFASASHGVTAVPTGRQQVRAIWSHTGDTLRVPVTVPTGGRLDLSLGIPRDREPVDFHLSLAGEAQPRLSATVSRAEAWPVHSIDLADRAGEDVTLELSASSDRPGAVALWGSPILSASTPSQHPNVVLYVIDGAGADYMSLYGYERDTTPFLAELAAEGTVFERVHTTSGWTKSSTASFMTSLHHSVLGGFSKNEDQIPASVITLGQRFKAAGYQAAVFTSNPFALTMSGLERGLDLYRDRHATHNSASSAELQAELWQWRQDWPGEPYWVHLQTTDVHEPHHPVGPAAGRWVSPEERDRFVGWWEQLHRTQGPEMDTVLGRYRDRLGRMGVDPHTFFDLQRGLYDETMAHNDDQLRQLVATLKARGEWERTLLIVTSDHGHPAGSFSRFGRGLLDPAPDDWEGALADSHRSRVPLLMVWPGHVPAGRRVEERVSMIDLLPTVLDLAGLPAAEPVQGQSLVPLIQGQAWQPRPVVLDQLQAHEETGHMVGHIELVDGRWAASMEVMPATLRPSYVEAGVSLKTAGGWRAARPHRPSTPALLLYDIEADPLCTKSVNSQHREVVAELTVRLGEVWAEHQALARRFEAGGEVEVGEDQLEALRVLGYVE